MLLRLVYDDRLAQAAYLIGCQRTGEAIVIDPQRDVDRYIDLAKANGLRIAGVTETHIHADFLSGSRELAERTGARVYVSGEGGPDWQYQWLSSKSGGGSYDHKLLKNGDVFRVGNIELKAIHTPGHTPEHMCFMVTDRGGGAGEPMGVATGDFVFVGDLGRPDLLETAAGQAGASRPGAVALHRSVRKFLDLPDYLQVWPGHGAGSACGKALGAVPQTTVGYERRFNPAIVAAASEDGFVDFILAGQPEPPMYFARMKRQNKEGPRILGEVPRPREIPAEEAAKLDGKRVAIVDTRPQKDFAAGHLPGALLAPLDNMFAMVVGSYIGEEETMYLVAEAGQVEELVRNLVRIGLDRVAGWISPATMERVREGGGRLEALREIDAAAAGRLLSSDGPVVLDVRRADEFAEGHIGRALHCAYPRLPERLGKLPREKEILVNCRSGARSGRACAYLARQGFRVTNLAGGYLAWEKAGLAVER
jgi:hydroxyacylglutathione hydrolase